MYKNKISRENAYQSILDALNDNNLTVKSVKTKIKNLRSIYHSELKKVKESKHSGTDGSVYKPSLAWFDEMHSFLDDSAEYLQTISSKIEIQSQCDLGYSMEITQSETVEEVLSPSSNDSSMARKPIPQRLTWNSTAPTRVRKRASSTERALQGLQEIVKKLDEQSTIEVDSEYECFGKSVACSLKKLTENVALESIAYIQSYLIQQRLTSNDEQITRPTSSASSTSCEQPQEPSDIISETVYIYDEL